MSMSEDLEFELAYLEANGKELKWWDLVCPDCKTEVTIVAVNDSDLFDYEMVTCPTCNSEIQKIRADIGYRIAEIRKPDK